MKFTRALGERGHFGTAHFANSPNCGCAAPRNGVICVAATEVPERIGGHFHGDSTQPDTRGSRRVRSPSAPRGNAGRCVWRVRVGCGVRYGEANAKSALSLLMLGAPRGVTVTVVARGNDAAEAIATVEELFGSKFGEESAGIGVPEPVAQRTV